MSLFFTSGVLFAVWGVHIPVVKAHWGLSDAEVAWLLLSASAGALTAMAAVGRWIDRAGSAAVSRLAVVALAIGFASLMWWPTIWALAIALLLFGACQSALDVAMNAQAVALEARLGRPVMSRLHGMFSVGGIVGSALGSAALAQGWSAERTFGVGGAAALCGLVVAAPRLLAMGAPQAPGTASTSAGRAARRRLLWALGTLALVGLVIEGAMYDWSSVYQHDVLALPTARVGTGYAAFSIGMAAARFAGDATRRWLGSVRLVQTSGALCVAGVLLLVVEPAPLTALIGFATLGVGCANLVPVLFAEAAVVGGGSATAIAFVARLAYVGLLIGPVLIGVLSARVGLQQALWLLAVGSVAVLLAARPTLRLVRSA